jgi:hypothetical protein
MYIYDMGYYTYEESDYHQICHEQKYNDKEFEEIVIKAAINILKEKETKKEERISFQDILHDVVEELIKNFGFKEVKFTVRHYIFGWPNILDEKDWKGDRGKELNQLTKRIKEVIKLQ